MWEGVMVGWGMQGGGVLGGAVRQKRGGWAVQLVGGEGGCLLVQHGPCMLMRMEMVMRMFRMGGRVLWRGGQQGVDVDVHFLAPGRRSMRPSRIGLLHAVRRRGEVRMRH